MNIAHTPQEVWVTKDAGKKAIMLGIENGYAIGKDLVTLLASRSLESAISRSATTVATIYATLPAEKRNGRSESFRQRSGSGNESVGYYGRRIACAKHIYDALNSANCRSSPPTLPARSLVQPSAQSDRRSVESAGS